MMSQRLKHHIANSDFVDTNKLNKAIDFFESQHQNESFPGGQLVLRCNGKLVVSVAIGIARGYRSTEGVSKKPVTSQTVFPALSAGKPLAAIAISLLEDRGILNIHTPIAELIPEFGKHGKEKITVLDVLTHRAGLLMPKFVANIHAWGSRDEIRTALIESVPVHPRGTLAYHPHEYGWILNEIVVEVDGRNLPVFFKDEIAIPLGLPDLGFGKPEKDVNDIAYSYWLGLSEVIVAGANVARNFEWQNSDEFFKANNPAISLLSNAESIAAFYDFLLSGGVAPDGKRLISKDLLHQYTGKNVIGWDRSLKTVLAIGRGFAVGTWFPSIYGWRNTGKCFGHAGGFSCLAFGDYNRNISVAILTNGNQNLSDFARRFMPLAHGLRNSCKIQV